MALLAVSQIDFWQFVLITAGVYTVFALGLQLQFGFAGLLNFGHIGFMAVGSYTMALWLTKVHLIPGTEWYHFVLHLIIGGTVATAAAMLFGLIVGLPALRLRADYLAITTIAFGEIIRIFILNLQSITGGPQGLYGAWTDFTGLAQIVNERVPSITQERLVLILAWTTALVGTLFLRRMVRSPWGRVLRAIREDEDAANALGKDPLRYKLQAMAIGAAFAAIAGFFLSFQFLFIIDSFFEPINTFFAWVIVLLGGTARLRGVPVGAVLFGLIFAGTRFLEFWPLSLFGDAERASLRFIVIGLILIGLMAFRPQGLFGKREELLLER